MSLRAKFVACVAVAFLWIAGPACAQVLPSPSPSLAQNVHVVDTDLEAMHDEMLVGLGLIVFVLGAMFVKGFSRG